MDGRPDSYDPAQTTVSMVANKITVSPLMRGAPDFSASIPPLNLDQTVGSLPPGTYAVEVIRRATGRGTLGVAQAGTAIIAFNLQDSNLALINFTIDGVSFVRVIERLPY